MNLIADILLAGGAFGVAVYCVVLSRRLSRFTDLERGVGGAVAVLSAQVDALTKALESAKSSADRSGETLGALTERAEEVSRRLELHVASLHDLEPAAGTPAAPAPSAAPDGPRTQAPDLPEQEAPAVATPMPSFRSATPRQAAAGQAGFAPAPRTEAEIGAAPAAPAPRGAAGPAPMSFRSAARSAVAEESAPASPASPRVPSYFSRRPAAAAK